MASQVGSLIIALIAALLFFLAIGYHGWPCGSSVLSSNCIRNKIYETTGALLLTAGLLVFVAAIFLIVVLATDADWSEIVATVFATVSAVLAIAGVFYYIDRIHGQWSPFLATVAMALNVALAAILLSDLITSNT